MAVGIWNVEWLNQNSQRAYPFTTWATRTDINGLITIPNSFILGIDIPVATSQTVQTNHFYLKTLAIFPTGYNIEIGYDENSQESVCSVNIAKQTHVENNVYAMPGINNFVDSVGKIVIGKLDELEDMGPGIYEFNRTGGQLEVDCIRPIIRGLTSFKIRDASGNVSNPMYGNIELVAGTNIRISATSITTNPTITISAITGDEFAEDCSCEDVVSDIPIRRINGIPPLPNGNFKIVGDDCIEIGTTNGGITLTDKCSSPCCGCEELLALEAAIQRLSDGAKTLENFVSRLQGEVTQMDMVLLGSTLSDQGCVGCG